MRIFNADGSKLFATILAINNFRLTATGKTVMLFSERPADAPDALKAWFYPNNNWGQEFVYPKRRAIQLAAAVKEPIPALTTDTLPVEARIRGRRFRLSRLLRSRKKCSGSHGNSDRSTCCGEYDGACAVRTGGPGDPATAQDASSLLPLVALLGVASLGFAFVLKRIAG